MAKNCVLLESSFNANNNLTTNNSFNLTRSRTEQMATRNKASNCLENLDSLTNEINNFEHAQFANKSSVNNGEDVNQIESHV